MKLHLPTALRAALCAVLLANSTAMAADYTWSGAWTEPLPGTEDTVIFSNDASSKSVNVTSALSVNSLFFTHTSGTYTLAAGSDGSVSAETLEITGGGTVQLNSAVDVTNYNVSNGNLTIWTDLTDENATISIGANGSLTLGTTYSLTVDRINMADGSHIYLHNGNGIWGRNLNADINVEGVATISGSINGNNSRVNGTIKGNGTLALASGGGHGTNTWTLTSTISDGSGESDVLNLTINSNVTISGNNSFSGGTTVTGAALKTGHANALGGGALVMEGGSLTLNAGLLLSTLDGTNAATTINTNAKALTLGNGITDSSVSANYAGALTGGGTLTKIGEGTQALSGAVALGDITVSGGALQLTGGVDTTTVTGTLSVAAGASLALNGLLNLDSTISNSGTLSLEGTLNIDAAAWESYSLSEIPTTENGFVSHTYTIISNGEGATFNTEGLNVTFNGLTLDAAGVTLSDDFTTVANQYGEYHVLSNSTATYGGATSTENITKALKIVLNGGELTMAENLSAATQVEGIVVSTASSILLEDGVTLDQSHLSKNAELSLKGSGTYAAHNAVTNGQTLANLFTNVNLAGLRDATLWTGTVKLSGSTELQHINPNAIGHSGSTVEFGGVYGYLAADTVVDDIGGSSGGYALIKPNVEFSGTGAALTLSNGNSDNKYDFTGRVSGTGDLKITANGPGDMFFKFSGDVSGWSGKLHTNRNSDKDTYVTFTGDALSIDADMLSEGGTLNLTFNNTAESAMGIHSSISDNSGSGITQLSISGGEVALKAADTTSGKSAASVTLSNTASTVAISGTGTRLTVEDGVTFTAPSISVATETELRLENATTVTSTVTGAGTLSVVNSTERTQGAAGANSTLFKNISGLTASEWTGTVVLSGTGQLKAINPNSIGHVGSTVAYEGISGWIDGDNNIGNKVDGYATIAPNVEFRGSGAALTLVNGASNNKYNFTGNVSGNGNFVINLASGSNNPYFKFSGDVSGWSGALKINNSNKTAHVMYTGNALGITNAMTAEHGTLNLTFNNTEEAAMEIRSAVSDNSGAGKATLSFSRGEVVLKAADETNGKAAAFVALSNSGSVVTLSGTDTRLTVEDGVTFTAPSISVGEGTELRLENATTVTSAISGSGTLSVVNGTESTQTALFTHLSGLTNSTSWTGTVALSGSGKLKDINTNSIGNAESTVEFNGVNGYFTSTNSTFNSDIKFTGTGADGTGTALTINNGYSGRTYTFAGTVSGAGDFRNETINGGAQTYKFTGDVSGWTGQLYLVRHGIETNVIYTGDALSISNNAHVQNGYLNLQYANTNDAAMEVRSTISDNNAAGVTRINVTQGEVVFKAADGGNNRQAAVELGTSNGSKVTVSAGKMTVENGVNFTAQELLVSGGAVNTSGNMEFAKVAVESGANMVVNGGSLTVSGAEGISVAEGAELAVAAGAQLDLTALEFAAGAKLTLSSGKLSFTLSEAAGDTAAAPQTTLVFLEGGTSLAASTPLTMDFESASLLTANVSSSDYTTIDVSSWSAAEQTALLNSSASLFEGVANTNNEWDEGQRAWIVFGEGNANNGLYNLALNELGNVYISSSANAIPEPTTATLSLLALSALAARRRRRS